MRTHTHNQLCHLSDLLRTSQCLMRLVRMGWGELDGHCSLNTPSNTGKGGVHAWLCTQEEEKEGSSGTACVTTELRLCKELIWSLMLMACRSNPSMFLK